MNLDTAQPEICKVAKLFYGKIFRIPAYQRSYAWRLENWQDFWNDVKEGLSTETEHYWGTITLHSTKETKDCSDDGRTYEVFDVIDGQQRLTTLVLLLLALSGYGVKHAKSNYVKTGELYRLVMGQLNDTFFRNLVDSDKSRPEPENTTNRLIFDAYKFFENELKNLPNGWDVNKVAKYLQNTTYSLEFDVLDDTMAIKSFMSLNTRGKQTTLLDNTKAFLMYYSTLYCKDKEDENKLILLKQRITNAFGNIFNNYDYVKDAGKKYRINYVGSMSDNDLLRLFYHYFAAYSIHKYKLTQGYDRYVSAEKVFSEYLQNTLRYLRGSKTDLSMFINDFCSSFDNFLQAFRELLDEIGSGKEPMYKKIFCFMQLSADVYPLIIALKTEKLLNQSLIKLIECLDMRLYKTYNTGILADLYDNITSQIKIKPDSTWVCSQLTDFINAKRSDATFQSFIEQDGYGNSAAKYILWEFETTCDKSFDTNDYGKYELFIIEHIFRNDAAPFPFPSLGFDNPGEYQKCINLFGNLCLLTSKENSIVKLMNPSTKASHYKGFVASRTNQLGVQINNNGFEKKDLEMLTKNISLFCINRWKT